MIRACVLISGVSIVFIFFFTVILALSSIKAQGAERTDWLEQAWETDGGPAITLNAQGVELVLPAKTLKEALRTGLSERQIVTTFIERWGQHCASDNAIDLDKPQRLTVELSTSHPVSVPRNEFFMGRRIVGAYELEKGATVSLNIDYKPTRIAHCVDGDELEDREQLY